MIKEQLNNLGDRWIEEKKQRITNLLKIALPDEALYHEIMLSLDYPKNKVQLLELALFLQYSEIRIVRTRQLIEKALLYRAGFIEDSSDLPENFDVSLKMNRSAWTFKGSRLANFPDKRIIGISNLLAESIEKGLVNFFIDRINSHLDNKNPKDALKKIMHFDGIGINRKEEMFFNIISPFMLAYTKNNEIHIFLLYLFDNHPPLKENSLLKLGKKKYNFPLSNVKEYMGLIYLGKSERFCF